MNSLPYIQFKKFVSLLVFVALSIFFTQGAYAVGLEVEKQIIGQLKPGAPASICSGGKVEQDGLCYEKPRDNYSCTGISCSERCPDGYKSSGPLTCHFDGPLTISMKEYAKKHESTKQKCIAFWYKACRQGYSMNSGHCGTCSFDGKWDVTRSSYTRNTGTLPPGVVHAIQGLDKDLNNAYEAAKNYVRNQIKSLEEAVFRTWQANATKYAKVLFKGLSTVKNDTKAMESISRLKQIGNQIGKTGNVSDPAQMKKDMEFLRSLIANADLPAVPVSTFGVGVVGSGGAGTGGASLGTVFSVDTKGKMSVALCTAKSIGVKAGADVSMQLSWASGDVKSNTGGGFIGASIGIEGEVGAEMEVTVSTDYVKDIISAASIGKIPSGVIPSIAVGPAVGEGLNFTMTSGACYPVWIEK